MKFLSLSFILLLSLCSRAISVAEEQSASDQDRIVKIRGVRKNIVASITAQTENGYETVKRCLTPYKETITTAYPFHITLSSPKRGYGAIRREQSDAIQDGNTYIFDIKLDSSELEETRYVQGLISERLDTEKVAACRTFTKAELSNKVKACYKLKPTLPPSAVRSGWCKIAFVVMEDGRVSNVEARDCSEEMFKINSLETVKSYRYYPRIKDNEISKIRIITTLRYALDNGRGKVIPPKKPLVKS